MYKKIVEQIIYDFKSFFTTHRASKFIKYRWTDEIQGMKACRTGSNSIILISTDLKYLKLDDDCVKLLILFMLSHEMAHLINRHLEYNDRNNFDSKSIEMWADFFGAKIAMLILQNGQCFRGLLKSNFNDVNVGLEEIFKALNILNQQIYQNTNSSKKYLNSNDRVSITVAGITAFLTRKDMVRKLDFSEECHADIGFDWGMAINKKLYDLGYFSTLYTANKVEDINITSLVKNVFEIHQMLKTNNRTLVKGLFVFHDYILDTTYSEHKPNQLLVKRFNDEITSYGWDEKLLL